MNDAERPLRAVSGPVYLAGPEVFLPDARAIGARKVAICRRHGFDAVFPLDEDDPVGLEGAALGHHFFERCVAMMDRCGWVIANMTPFRGVSMDVGTAVEIGYMHARGRAVFGYTNVVDDYAARVAADGFEIEAFGFADNLMCEGPVRHSGNEVVRTAVARAELLTDLTGFERCVRRAADRTRPAG